MNEPRTIVWFSCGAPSAIAARMTPGAELVYCNTRSEHPDNERFILDVERWLDRPVTRLASEKYHDTWDVWERERYMAGIHGAPCTGALKVALRIAYQRPTDIHVFGYADDANDVGRFDRLQETFPELTLRAPLIKAGITKVAAIAMVERAGIAKPIMYDLGFHNNNCLFCPKATSPSYYANVRKHFPGEFARGAALSRELGARLCRIDGERRFIDEIPADHPTTNPIQPACDFLCHIAEEEFAPSQTSAQCQEGS